MAASPTSKLFAASANLLSSSASSITHRRPLTCICASYASPRIAPYPADLIKWVRREGGYVHPKLKVADHSSQGLGLVADGEISTGTELINLPDHIPLRLRWKHDAADLNDRPESALFRLVHRVPEELWAMRLGLKLLQERATAGSFWWPYVGNLPATFNIPIFFSGEEIKNIQYAPLVYQVNKRCKFLIDFENEAKLILADTTTLEDHPFSGQDVTAASLGWAMSAVSSRAFRLRGKTPDGSQDDIPMLLPLIDMCNHSFHPNARILQQANSDDQKMLIQVMAETHIRHGTPVTLNYGCLSNDFFLLDYGFVVPSNPYDYVELRYDPLLLDAACLAAGVSPSFSSPNSWQIEFLSQLKFHGEVANLKVVLGGPELVDGRLLAALRILLSTDVETVRQLNLDKLMSFCGEAPLGVPTEIATLRTVIGLCAISLQYFPTNNMEDEDVLKRDISDPMKLVVQFRLQKKSMVVNVMRELSRRIGQLRPETSTVQS